jgi:DnaJ-class molecular chaperone
MHLHVVVDTPTRLTEAQEELLRSLAKARGEDVDQPAGGLLGRIRSAFS